MNKVIRAGTILSMAAVLILMTAGVLPSAPKAKGEDILLGPGQAVRIARMAMPQFGLVMRNAVDLAIEQFGGTFLGHPIQTKHYGKGCDLRAELDGFVQGLIRESKTVGLIGPICSGRTARIVQTLSDAKILTISPDNTARELTEPAFHDLIPFYFRTSPTDAFQGPAGAAFAQTPTAQGGLGAASAAIIYYDEGYSNTLREGFKKTFSGSILEFPIQFEHQDFTDILDAVMGQVDVIYAPVFVPDLGPLYQQ